jgi:arsenate reductase-like glutaredoxin family protein
MEQTQISGPDCSKCKKPMAWHSEQSVGTHDVNVFQCKPCKKLTAVSVGAAAKRA